MIKTNILTKFHGHQAHNIAFNPLPDMPILGSSSSAANKDLMSKIWTNEDTII